MIRLQLLGGVRLLDGDGRDVRAVMQQPKRLAVLAYLAVARPRGAQRRDALIAMFWGESDEASARRSLSQTLYFLRQKIHDEIFAGRFGEEVGLRESEITCDVVAFEDALDDGRAAEALALYGGDLMPGFHISDAPEWEKWLDVQRDRLRGRAAEAAWSLAGSEEAAGNAGPAAHWARWAAALSPYDEKQHRRVLELLVRAGDRAGALRAHEEFSRRLALEFEVEPSPETAALIEAIRRDAGGSASGGMVERAARGLERRPAAAASSAAPARVADPGGASRSSAARLPAMLAPPGAAWWRGRRGRRLLAIAVSVVLVSAVWVVALERDRGGDAVATVPDQPLDRIAILPFRDLSPDGELGYFADGLATTLTDRLTDVDQLSIVSTNSTRQFDEASVTVDSMGRALNVGAVVGGSVARSGEDLRVSVELIDARTGTTLATQTVQHEQGDLFRLLDEIASSVAWMLRTELGQEVELRTANLETQSVRAWELVQMSREMRESSADQDRSSARAALRAAMVYLDQASELDPDYVSPYVERSRIYQTLLLLHHDDPAHAAALHDSAEAAADRAVTIDTTRAEAFEQRAGVRFFAWLLQPRDERVLLQAEADVRRALDADPHRARSAALLSQILYQRGEFRQAYQAASRAYRADTYAERVEDVVVRLFETSFELGNDDEAAKWCDELRRRAPEHWLQYQCELTLLAFATSGEPDVRKALRAFDAARRLPTVAESVSLQAHFTALVGASYARDEQPDSARAVLERALAAAPEDQSTRAVAAATYLRLGDTARGSALIRSYLERAPAYTRRVLSSRLFAPLDQQARDQLLVTDTR